MTSSRFVIVAKSTYVTDFALSILRSSHPKKVASVKNIVKFTKLFMFDSISFVIMRAGGESVTEIAEKILPGLSPQQSICDSRVIVSFYRQNDDNYCSTTFLIKDFISKRINSVSGMIVNTLSCNKTQRVFKMWKFQRLCLHRIPRFSFLRGRHPTSYSIIVV